MKVGTKSVLWGVHAFWWHPLTVLVAWRKLYGSYPNWWETVAIILHDTPGYFGCAEMDGPEGELHPERGARWTRAVVKFFGGPADEAYYLARYHSRFYAFKCGAAPSKLAWADKLCVHYDPKFFYLLRAKLSGEIAEYRRNAAECVPLWLPDSHWLFWYREKVTKQVAGRVPATAGHHIDGDNKA